MLMRELAEAFSALEATTKRLEMMGILGQLFRRADPDDAQRIVYLLSGRVGPPFEPLEFGMNEALIIRTLSIVAERPQEEVERLYRDTGDLGLVAEQLREGPTQGVSVEEVFHTLRQICLATGAGAHERKVELLGGLLHRLDGLEARYVVRIIHGRLRLGVGDATIIDALSWAHIGDKRYCNIIKRAYNLCSDLGQVARKLLTEGPTSLERLKPQVGKPVRVALAERLPSPQDIVRKLGRVAVEPKYDGLRVEVHKDGDRILLFTRREEDVTAMFPELVKAARRQIKAHQAIIDGEAIVYNPETGEYLPFQITAQRRRKYGIEEMEARYPLRLFAFDVLYVDGEDYTPRPLIERRRKLEEILDWQPDDPIQLTEQLITSDAGELERFFTDQVQRGLEGILAKRIDAPYRSGERTFDWVKLKRGYRAELRDTVDVVLVGYLVGKGKRARFGIGSLLGAVYDDENDRFRTVSKIGSGPTEEEWQELKRLLDQIRVDRRPARVDSLIVPDVWVEPRYVVEVQADEITRSPYHTAGKVGDEPGYALRFPRMVGWIRFDKSPEDATTEREILEMYRMQQRTTLGRRAA